MKYQQIKEATIFYGTVLAKRFMSMYQEKAVIFEVGTIDIEESKPKMKVIFMLAFVKEEHAVDLGNKVGEFLKQEVELLYGESIPVRGKIQ